MQALIAGLRRELEIYVQKMQPQQRRSGGILGMII
jgi:hypothetical protein